MQPITIEIESEHVVITAELKRVPGCIAPVLWSGELMVDTEDGTETEGVDPALLKDQLQRIAAQAEEIIADEESRRK